MGSDISLSGAKDSLTFRFAEKIVNSDPSCSAEAVNAAKQGLIDFLAAAFAGREEAGVKKLLSIVKEEGGKRTVPLIGRKTKANEMQAALINGFTGHVLDFDDVHSDVRGHPSTVILPALISAAANRNYSGIKFLNAYITGVEVMARLGQAVGSRHYLKGWHTTGTLGVIGAAAAIAYMKGFSTEQTAKTIGVAATQTIGLRAQFGTEMKPMHAGMAAQAAVMAAKLVECGIGCTDSILDGKLGFFEAYGEGGSFAEPFLLNDWGTSWRIVKPGLWFKIYPFCSAAHHAADAAAELRERHKIEIRDIKEVTVWFPPDGDAALVSNDPKTGEQGRFSVEYVVALILCGYRPAFDMFRDKDIKPDIRKAMSKIRRCYDLNIKPSENAVPAGRFTIVEVVKNDGQSVRVRVDCPKGAPGNGLSLQDLQQKLMNSLKDKELSEQLFNRIINLNSEDELKDFIELLNLKSH